MAELRLRKEVFILQESFFFNRVLEIPHDGEVLFQVLIGTEARDRSGDELVIQSPFQQCSLTHGRQLFPIFRVGLGRTARLRFHSHDSDSTLCRSLDHVQHWRVMRHGIVQGDEEDIENVLPHRFRQNFGGLVCGESDKPGLALLLSLKSLLSIHFRGAHILHLY